MSIALVKQLKENNQDFEFYPTTPEIIGMVKRSIGTGDVHNQGKEFGSSSWELDALEPKILRKLIEDTVYPYRDPIAYAEVMESERADKTILDNIVERWADFA